MSNVGKELTGKGTLYDRKMSYVENVEGKYPTGVILWEGSMGRM